MKRKWIIGLMMLVACMAYAVTIQMKLGSGAPTSLIPGEFAVDTNSMTIYMGNAQSNPVIVAGSNIATTNNVNTFIVTNVMADYASILAASVANLDYPIIGVATNMVVSIGRPPTQDAALNVVGIATSNGYVTLRAQNVGGIAVDQGNVMYRIQVTSYPIQ